MGRAQEGAIIDQVQATQGVVVDPKQISRWGGDIKQVLAPPENLEEKNMNMAPATQVERKVVDSAIARQGDLRHQKKGLKEEETGDNDTALDHIILLAMSQSSHLPMSNTSLTLAIPLTMDKVDQTQATTQARDNVVLTQSSTPIMDKISQAQDSPQAMGNVNVVQVSLPAMDNMRQVWGSPLTLGLVQVNLPGKDDMVLAQTVSQKVGEDTDKVQVQISPPAIGDMGQVQGNPLVMDNMG